MCCLSKKFYHYALKKPWKTLLNRAREVHTLFDTIIEIHKREDRIEPTCKP